MNRFLSNLIAALRKFRGASPTSARQRRARLRVETMEQRMVPSTVTPVAHATTTPALTAPLLTSTGSDGGVTVDPLQPVHGYKWRRPRPWEMSAGETTRMTPGISVAVLGHAPEPGQAHHLAVGGSDKILVMTSPDGHVIVRPPEGPLPSEGAFTGR
jgi:hypothetical protein